MHGKKERIFPLDILVMLSLIIYQVGCKKCSRLQAFIPNQEFMRMSTITDFLKPQQEGSFVTNTANLSLMESECNVYNNYFKRRSSV